MGPTFGEGSAVTGYGVTATDDSTPANGGQTCTGTDPTDSCSLSGLTDGDSYTFAVTATNAIGTSAAGSVTVTEGAPSAPTGASATAGNGSASVSFSPPATSGDGSAVSSYTVTATDATNPANGGQSASGVLEPDHRVRPHRRRPVHLLGDRHQRLGDQPVVDLVVGGGARGATQRADRRDGHLGCQRPVGGDLHPADRRPTARPSPASR